MKSNDLFFWQVWINKKGKVVRQRIPSKTMSNPYLLKGQLPSGVKRTTGPATVITVMLMPGELKDWHENLKPQWIIPLHGRWAVEAMDGGIVEMGPGDISFGGDQGAHNKRHRSWTIGETPAELLLLQVSKPPPWNPCN